MATNPGKKVVAVRFVFVPGGVHVRALARNHTGARYTVGAALAKYEIDSKEGRSRAISEVVNQVMGSQ